MKNNKQDLDVLSQLEEAKAFLVEDIQALMNIETELQESVTNIDVKLLRNSVGVLLRAMLYSENQMKQTINIAYNLMKGNKNNE